MKIYLIDINEKICAAWDEMFAPDDQVTIYNIDFKTFMDTVSADIIVSPANSFGIMSGGYDLAITKYFGTEPQKKVQEYIKTNFHGEQPVGTSFYVPIQNDKYLIHTPTMRYPKIIKDNEIVYHCMRSTLLCAKKLENIPNVNAIVIPAFGGATGGVPEIEVAYYMHQAYMSLIGAPQAPYWYAINHLLD